MAAILFSAGFLDRARFFINLTRIEFYRAGVGTKAIVQECENACEILFRT